MPLYQYKCVECDCVIDRIRRMDDRMEVELSECINSTVTQDKENKLCEFKYKISNSSKPILKGSGFYETDYK